MKIYELNRGDEFFIRYIDGDMDYGIFLGMDGMYAKVQFNNKDYSNPPFGDDWDLLGSQVEVERVKD